MTPIGPDLRVIARLRGGREQMFTGIVEAQRRGAYAVATDKGGRVTIVGGRAGSVRRSGRRQHCRRRLLLDRGEAGCRMLRRRCVPGNACDCTAGLRPADPVNLEKALRLSDRLGGHLVSGHVDGVGEVTRFEPVGESWLLEVRVPAAAGEVSRPQRFDHGERRQPDGESGRDGTLCGQPDSAHPGGHESGGAAGRAAA